MCHETPARGTDPNLDAAAKLRNFLESSRMVSSPSHRPNSRRKQHEPQVPAVRSAWPWTDACHRRGAEKDGIVMVYPPVLPSQRPPRTFERRMGTRSSVSGAHFLLEERTPSTMHLKPPCRFRVLGVAPTGAPPRRSERSAFTSLQRERIHIAPQGALLKRKAKQASLSLDSHIANHAQLIHHDTTHHDTTWSLLQANALLQSMHLAHENKSQTHSHPCGFSRPVLAWSRTPEKPSFFRTAPHVSRRPRTRFLKRRLNPQTSMDGPWPRASFRSQSLVINLGLRSVPIQPCLPRPFGVQPSLASLDLGQRFPRLPILCSFRSFFDTRPLARLSYPFVSTP